MPSNPVGGRIWEQNYALILALLLFIDLQPEVKQLLGVLQSLRVSEKKFTNKFAS